MTHLLLIHQPLIAKFYNSLADWQFFLMQADLLTSRLFTQFRPRLKHMVNCKHVFRSYGLWGGLSAVLNRHS